jgi:hypothetical protein
MKKLLYATIALLGGVLVYRKVRSNLIVEMEHRCHGICNNAIAVYDCEQDEIVWDAKRATSQQTN